MRILGKSILLRIFGFLGLFLYPALSNAEFKWNKPEVVDRIDCVGSFTSIAIDRNNTPHISYYDASNAALKYATRISSPPSAKKRTKSQWNLATVDYTDYVGDYTSLKVASNGVIWIAYHDISHRAVRIAHKKLIDTTWLIDTVDRYNQAGFLGISLVIGKLNLPELCYYAKQAGELRHARLSNGKWRITVADNDFNVGMLPSIALDQRGFPRIAYYDVSRWNLKYAFWDGMQWISQVVDPGRSVGIYASLAIDKKGYPHIAYEDDLNYDLKYAFWNGYTWQIDVVDRKGVVGKFASLALDSADNPRIGYFDYTHGQIKFAYQNGRQPWVVQTIDPKVGVGGYCSLALDNLGNPHLSYYDYLYRDLRYIHGILQERTK
ncbi:MAG: hypothetical protein ACE14V_03710 [bacterium]